MSDAPITYVDDPKAPELFTHGAYGFRVVAGVVSLTLVSSRVDHNTKSEYAVVIGTLQMPVAAAQSLAVGLYNFLDKQGLGPEKPKADELQ